MRLATVSIQLISPASGETREMCQSVGLIEFPFN
jgi:hypothetical protein